MPRSLKPRDLIIDNRNRPGIVIEVVQERPRAITWLVQPDGSGWDEVVMEA